MFELQTKENQAEFSVAVETLKEELSDLFNAAEKTDSTLHLFRDVEGKRVDLLAEEDPKELLYYVKYNNNVVYSLSLKKESGFIKKKSQLIEIAHFRLVEMPGCCGVVISTGAFTDTRYQRRGIGTALNKFRIAIAKAIGYTTMMCTAIDDGITERILNKNGWTRIGSFVNRRTNNSISMYSVMLSTTKEK